ncbi:Ribosomal large subunit pseudouridine synthase B [hydrothermal vent metagenome]|uniref:Ribosomal large subunit pseudouridine synthase B n=1 Tax=hydrothermal vent metagenome TaxID=652676 RepID=A0A3B0RLQ0_9ZZZZ
MAERPNSGRARPGGLKSSGRKPAAARPFRKKTTRASKPAASNAAGERLQKIMARAGIASRRKAEELITDGRVFVNGSPVTELGARADVAVDKIEVDGNVISSKGPRVYILLYKPTSTISAVSDPEGRAVVVDLIKGVKHRIFPVGRLDYDAEGVLLLTNDGELTNKLIHPRSRVPKTYLVKVKGKPDQNDIKRLAEGVYLDDGRTLPARAKFVKAALENSWIELTVTEGRNHLVKRMCLKIGHPVAKIRRTDFAGIKIGSLKPGEFRVLTKAEVEALKDLKETTIKARARGGRPLAKGRSKKE